MKEYKILKIIESAIDITFQEVMVAELSEITYKNYMQSNHHTYQDTEHSTDLFVFDLNSKTAEYIVNRVFRENIVTLDINDFIPKREFKNGHLQHVFYHKNVLVLTEHYYNSKLLFDITITKVNHRSELKLNRKLEINQIDIALKDICIFLRSESKKKGRYEEKSEGEMSIRVEHNDREMTDEERKLVNLREMPVNQVTIEHYGFSFEEICQLLNNLQHDLFKNIKGQFIYKVDFEKLTID